MFLKNRVNTNRGLKSELSKLVSTVYPMNTRIFFHIWIFTNWRRITEHYISDASRYFGEQDVKQDMEDDTNIDKAKITSKEAMQLANQLKTFSLSTNDAVSLLLVSWLQPNFKNQIAIQEKKTNILKFPIFSPLWHTL